MKKGKGQERELVHVYKTKEHYALNLSKKKDGWTVDLTLSELPKEVQKGCKSKLFGPFVEEPRAFTVMIDNEEVGWVEVGYHAWNNRMRIWELLVKEGYRKQGIGEILIKKAEEIARERGARMVVLETQSCNIEAIKFYLSRGYKLIGFDSTAYTNNDVNRGEIRLEFGLQLS